MQHQIVQYARAGYPGLYIISPEEARIENEVEAAAKETKLKFFSWSSVTGILDHQTSQNLGGADPIELFDIFAKLPEKSLLLLKDFHLCLAGDPANPFLVRKLKDALNLSKKSNRMLIILACRQILPPELEKDITILDAKLPNRDQIKQVLDGFMESTKSKIDGSLEAILDAASGLTTNEAENAFALSAVRQKGKITADIIAKEKAQTIRKNGILELIDTSIKMTDIGGMSTLKQWLVKRRSAFSKEAKTYGLPTPKGALLVGIPGTGKSLSAKATAAILEVPLLKLDAGKLFGSLVGQSEANMRTALQVAEATAPCVLWIDEIEKGFSGTRSSGSTDGGTGSRVFGTFLTWLNDKTAPVFVIATANDISQLPPEFLRKGRFDEMFFVDLPTATERNEIWNVQINRHNRKPTTFNLDQLTEESDGFTGAEIEACVREALFAAFSENREPDTNDIVVSLQETVPLSKTMAAEVQSLRDWSKGRARSASTSLEAKVQQVLGKLGGRKLIAGDASN
jgi:SpoVK/Ycf46/Vps4 family AAA+-type ATPase